MLILLWIKLLLENPGCTEPRETSSESCPIFNTSSVSIASGAGSHHLEHIRLGKSVSLQKALREPVDHKRVVIMFSKRGWVKFRNAPLSLIQSTCQRQSYYSVHKNQKKGGKVNSPEGRKGHLYLLLQCRRPFRSSWRFRGPWDVPGPPFSTHLQDMHQSLTCPRRGLLLGLLEAKALAKLLIACSTCMETLMERKTQQIHKKPYI